VCINNNTKLLKHQIYGRAGSLSSASASSSTDRHPDSIAGEENFVRHQTVRRRCACRAQA
jgi:hypothetical protein